MKILHVIGSLDPAWGGPPVVAASLASAQAARGNQVGVLSVVAPERRALTISNYDSYPFFEQLDCQWQEKPLSSLAILLGNPDRDLAEQVKKYDFVHLHGIWEPLLWHAATAARRSEVPYTHTIHGMLNPWSMRQKWLKKQVALLCGYRKMLNEAAFLHMLNDDEHRFVESQRLFANRKTVPNGIYLDTLDQQLKQAKDSDSQSRDILKPVSDSPYIIFMGRLHHVKGLDYLAEAFASIATEFPDVKLLIVGADGGVQADFEAYIQEQGLSKRVHLAGPLYGETKFVALSNAACFCLPSRQEGFSIAILEALASATPTVISTECHFPEVAEADAGYVTELSAPAVAQALRAVLREPENARLKGEKGRKLVEDRYTWASVAEQFDTLYRESI